MEMLPSCQVASRNGGTCVSRITARYDAMAASSVGLILSVEANDNAVIFSHASAGVRVTRSSMRTVSFKTTGRRVFRMAPLHHHYELKGWKENQVVVRFWIITMLLVLFGLSTLKLR